MFKNMNNPVALLQLLSKTENVTCNLEMRCQSYLVKIFQFKCTEKHSTSQHRIRIRFECRSA
jgi:hypothetical protein